MIYDCFAFFNELDLLEIRLNTLNSVVDKFVLVEATRTFQKKEKPLFFEENKERFKEFEDKIIHIVVDKYPNFLAKFRIPNAWDYDNHQKEFIKEGFKNAQPNDSIIISDLDEIPKPEKVKEYASKTGFKIFEQRLYFYFLNGLCSFYDSGNEEVNKKWNRNNIGFWRGTVMLNYQDFVEKVKTIKKARMLRDKPENEVHFLKDAGWHFTYLGGIPKIIEKIEAWAHSEFNKPEYKNPEKIKELIEQGKDLFGSKNTFSFPEIDESLPKYVQENAHKYPHLIKHT